MKSIMRFRACHVALLSMLASCCVFPGVVFAGVTDLSNAPLANGVTNTTTVKPNIAFIVDDSGSMDEQNMPDGESTNRGMRCWGWHKYNTLFYNPNETYKPPFKLDGDRYSDGVTRYPDAVFTAALKDGYFPRGGYTFSGDSNSNTETNLSNRSNLTPNAVACQSGEGCSGSTSKYYYSIHKTNPDSTTCEADSNYRIVVDPDKIGAPGIPDTGRTSEQIAAAKTNYANWYTYYRRRAMLMKAATGEAFKDLDESQYRVGLFFLNSEESGAANSTQNNNDLKIDDFSGSASGTQRHAWYAKLYGSRDGGWTPLRGALSRIGRMYAGQFDEWDPVQYSCQQNFAILSTDGYWNTNAETDSYGPKKINGTDNVGKQDGPAVGAASAKAKITIGGDGGCYRVTSVRVNTGGAELELLNAPVPGVDAKSCTTNVDTLGDAISKAINAKTAETEFTASYDARNDVVTITAPLSLGDFTATPAVTSVRESGTKTRTFVATAFRGGAVATSGAPLPYRDTLNIADTLADVAYYYYTTDLRNAVGGKCSNVIGSTTYSDLCKDNVQGSGKDTSNQQHMTTFTIGLGVNGTIKYEPDYETAKNIDGVLQYYDIVNGGANWPEPNTSLKRIDDLWHAAVNGRGTYYSATDASSLKQGIQSALAGIKSRKGSSSAAATSNLEPVPGDNFVYVALYQTVSWDGDLMAFSIDPSSGRLSTSEFWSAKAKLDEKVATATSGDGRTIKFFSRGQTDKLKDFTFTNLTADNLHRPFENICDKSPAIDQCGNDAGDLTTDQKALANSGTNLVNYLRGGSQFEDEASNATALNRIYRGRDHVLGDIVNAVPVYMKKPPFNYDKYDRSYGAFKTSRAIVDRGATVFVAANDGMLHAINAEDGTERWAYVPTFVMNNMWKLADKNYGNNHQYFVDGSPTIADVCASRDRNDRQLCASSSDWKTILVGGLNKGGCGYYALDVTNPATPKGLWEFTHENLGYSYGNPVVAKRKDGRWVVIVTSGYNNYPGNGCGNSGDGNGHVFVLDAVTGELLEDIPTYTSGSTPAGTSSTPSGLAKINAWIEDAALPIADRLYAGDLLGNLWRIDFDDNHAPDGIEAVRLAQLKDGGDRAQPITTKPELAVVPAGIDRIPVVLVGTGKYLGMSDLSDTSQQSIYALKDSLLSTGISNVRGTTVKARTMTETKGSDNGSLSGRIIRTISGANINWATDEGWRLDLNPNSASPGERVNVDMQLQYNILTVAANVPEDNACDVGGYAYLYFLDINSGKHLSTAVDSMAGMRLTGNALVAGIKTVRLTSGKTVTIVTDTAGNVGTEENPSPPGGGGAGVRRTTWREIPD